MSGFRRFLGAALFLAALPRAGASPVEIPPAKVTATPANPLTVEDGFYGVLSADDPGAYSAFAVIRRDQGLYLVQWLTSRQEQAMGVGSLSDGVLSVGWTVGEGPKLMRGVSVYRVRGRRLTGHWLALPGDGRRRAEVMQFLYPLARQAEPEPEPGPEGVEP
jgi:hypothetical protein